MITKVSTDFGNSVDANGIPTRIELLVSYYNPSEEEVEVIRRLHNSCLSRFKSSEKT